MTGHPPAGRFGRVVVLLVLSTPSSVLAADLYSPPAGHPDTKARGARVETSWSVDRAEVPEGEALTATLTVRGADNPREVVRPDLRKLPAYADRFEVEDVPGPAPADGANEVAFVYRLKPRNRGVDRLPSLDFYYRKVGVGEGVNPYMNARARGLPIRVTAAAAKPPPPAVPLAEPDRLFAVTTGPAVLGGEPFAPGVWAWLVLFLLGPLVAGGWYAGWRWKYPGAARAARLRRAKAARRAVRTVHRANRTPEPTATIAGAVAGYLRARFPLPPGTDTPAEVGEAVRAAGLPDEPAGEVVAFLRRCDAARFGGSGDDPVSLGAEAVALLGRLEAVE
jgi:hypothetical protein